MIVVSNATPLIALSKIGHLALLPQWFGTILLPQAVYDEVVTKGQGRPGAAQIHQADWIRVRSITDRIAVDYLRAELDPGEAEVLILAQEVSANWILVDEPKARLAAELLGLRVTGTLGLLLLARRMGRVPAIRPLLDELRANRFHLSDRVYQAVLEEAGE
jgi:uncharacterized protein